MSEKLVVVASSSARSECQGDGAGGWGLGSSFLSEMSRSGRVF